MLNIVEYEQDSIGSVTAIFSINCRIASSCSDYNSLLVRETLQSILDCVNNRNSSQPRIARDNVQQVHMTPEFHGQGELLVSEPSPIGWNPVQKVPGQQPAIPRQQQIYK